MSNENEFEMPDFGDDELSMEVQEVLEEDSALDVEVNEETVEEVAEKAPAKEVKPKVERCVRFVSIDPEASVVDGVNFEVHILSVGLRDFTFNTPSEALNWITRRIYNKEPLSQAVLSVHGLLRVARTIGTLVSAAEAANDWFDNLDLTKSRAGQRVGYHMNEFDRLIANLEKEEHAPVDDLKEVVANAREALEAFQTAILQNPVETVTNTVETGELDEDGNAITEEETAVIVPTELSLAVETAMVKLAHIIEYDHRYVSYLGDLEPDPIDEVEIDVEEDDEAAE